METDEILVTDENDIIDRIKLKHEKNKQLPVQTDRHTVHIQLRAFAIGFFGLVVSLYALTANPMEIEIDRDGEVRRSLQVITTVRKITKPVIRFTLGFGYTSAAVTAISSVMLMIGVMIKNYSLRFLAIPAILVIAMEIVSDASDALVATILIGRNVGMIQGALYISMAAFMIAVEITFWLVIVKFYEHNPPVTSEVEEIARRPFREPE